jgi:hypothetical protein
MADVANGDLTLKYKRNDQDTAFVRRPLGNDLTEAAFKVHDDSEAELKLRMAVTRLQDSPIDLGIRLTTLIQSIGVFKLLDRGNPLTEESVRSILRPYVLEVPGLRQTMAAYYGNLPDESTYLHMEKDPKGYYCPGCGGLIKTYGSNVPMEERHGCGARLLFDNI